MCLGFQEKATREYRKQIKNEKWVFVWKIVDIHTDTGKLFSPYMRSMRWKRGWNKSDRKSKRLSGYEQTAVGISQGFHVFTTLEAAQMNFGSIGYDRSMIIGSPSIVRLKTKPKYFVAANINQAVFTKLKLTKKDQNAARCYKQERTSV